MLDPNSLYELVEDLPDLGRPVLIQALAGFVDAGAAVRLSRDHLLATFDAGTIATFDVDQLLDYRSRRPAMIFVEDHWEHYEAPSVQVHLLRDAVGTPFLLLSGVEPDLQWERFTAAARELIQRLGVRLTVGLSAIPMAVPHTRPSGVTAHATRRELIPGYEPWFHRVQVPSSVGNVLEYQLGREGRDAAGFAVHVPHYLAQADYPAAAETLLASVSRVAGLVLPIDELRSAAELVRKEVDEQVGRDREASALVRALEQRYDAQVRGQQSDDLLAQSRRFTGYLTQDRRKPARRRGRQTGFGRSAASKPAQGS